MNILQAIILGIVQGLTEFLPVSSSGHLVLLNKFFGIEQFLFVSVMLHFATLVAVIIVLRREVWQLIRHPFSRKALLLYVATIPTVVIVLMFQSFFESAFNGSLLPVCFCITAVALLLVSLMPTKQTARPFKFFSAFCMGLTQGIACLPGISRSGATICTGLALGEDKSETTKFSFLMSIPIILASMLMEIIELCNGSFVFATTDILPLLFGITFAFISGLLAIKLMLRIVQNMRLWIFSIYLIILSLITLFI